MENSSEETLDAVVREDLGFLDITEHNALDKVQYRKRNDLADPNLLELGLPLGLVISSRQQVMLLM